MNYQNIKQATEDKFESLDFKEGDIFSEMLSHWKVIVKVENDKLTLISGSSQNLKLETYCKQEFKHLCEYKTRPGYWIDYMKNDERYIERYIDAYIQQQNMSLDNIREFKLNLVL